MDSLIKKIEQKSAKIGIIGMGYVGLPLALEFCKVGFDVTGIDLDKKKIDFINNGKSYIEDATDADIGSAVRKGRLHATTDFSVLQQIDTVSICVPTPLRKTKDPDISYIISATKEIKKYLHPGQLIVLESTTYPGTTDEIILPELASEVNPNMPYFVVTKVFDALNAHRKSINGSNILVLGVAYKKDVGDVRESPALDVIRLLKDKGGVISYNDPHIPLLHEDNMDLRSIDLNDYSALNNYDCTVIVTDHSSYDYKKVVECSNIVVDTRNATKGIVSDKIVRL